jgi:squalene-hopene/tetraprenyl-beta-curcumene cyclase
LNDEPITDGMESPNSHQATRRLIRRVAYSLGSAACLCVIVLIVWAGSRVRANSAAALGAYRGSWSDAAAAKYLDSREAWWQSWPTAQLSEGTVCLSCHTVVPYALARPGLRAALGEKELTPAENAMLDSIEKRVADWAKLAPYYTDPAHAQPSHATEAVLNALVLAEYSQQQPELKPIASRAFDEAWALQETSGEDAGGWEWQDFHEVPWESKESAYQGAAMLEIALGFMPSSYGVDPSTRIHSEQLRQYLVQHYAAQPAFNQLYVLWASTTTPGLLSDAQRADLMARVSKLQRADGGWSLPTLDTQTEAKKFAFDLFKRANNVDGSDGIATGLVVLALEKAGVSAADPMMRRGLAWLEAHQYEGGNWWASSMNGFRNPTTDLGRFMSDAATGYAVLALEQARDSQSALMTKENRGLPETRKRSSPRQ